ncbi:NAD-dependent epimerase/dehydratase family protein [Rhizobium puerariae]|uniref:NAD-dependent epimerase/dehydratase family protein n=1 Tax=Rhizobium puerariae TaxID=1585791 RepID=A0ABV6ARG8_9HYPH
MGKVCLITGGAGFIGRSISGRLTSCFDRVVAIDNLHPQVHPFGQSPSMHPAVEFIAGDVVQRDMWSSILADVSPSVIIHLAAETGTGQSLTESSRHASVNVCGTTVMMDALTRSGKIPERIVLASSRAVYGEGAWQDTKSGSIVSPGQRSRAMLEKGIWDFPGMRPLLQVAGVTPTNPTSVYGATKLAQEHLLSAWSQAFGVELNILRFQNVYGPGQSLKNPYTGVVSLFFTLARRMQPISVFEDGAISRDFVFVDDVVDLLLEVAANGGGGRQPYDVGSGTSTSLLELAYLVAGCYGAPDPKITGEFRNGDVRHASCDIARAKADYPWQPRWTMGDGVKALASWVDAQ